ncbi:MAG: DNA repair protein RadA, partial [Filifactor alocis]|nr:DNA repair protein RadA [Filifactor alocis]
QIKLRSNRLFSSPFDMMICNTNEFEQLESEIDNHGSDFVIVDSIQTISVKDLNSIQGSVSQVKEVTSKLMELAKGRGISIFVVGHVTKEGNLAGPKVLEHLVDTVIYFEGERYHSYRMIRAVKNRFGSTNELGVFEMTGEGLKEIVNPSALMLSEKPVDTAGSVIVATMEGSRPIMNEVQALTSQSFFPVPRRTATGVDYNRMNMLLAVLEKRAGFQIQNHDIYVNLTGGFRNNEPSIDLAILIAVASSYRNIPVGEDTVIFGEVGLTGEIRSVQNANKRIAEAEKLGFKRVVLPFNQVKGFDKSNLELIGVQTVAEAIKKIFGR